MAPVISAVGAFSSTVASSSFAVLREDPVMVWALMVTPPVTVPVLVEDVSSGSLPDASSVSVAFDADVEVDVDFEVPVEDVVPAVAGAAPLPVFSPPVVAVDDCSELADGLSDCESLVSAVAMPCPAATAVPIPKATAKPPTRPM
ncbi:hypothetical protein [Mycobacterium sp. IS-1590]|uniref:hypothetical protein n=1 Tax=Mycobacterium sp. IS-1590 TaxID=1772286 RepID=UPI001E452734|nr:hypothetical protein [Mycobacterium sp. IS-1590]